MDKRIIIAATFITCFLIGCITALSLFNKDTDKIMTVVGFVVLPLLIGFGAIKINEAKAEIAAGRVETQAVQRTVNGNTAELQAMVKASLDESRQRALDQDRRLEQLMETFTKHISSGGS